MSLTAQNPSEMLHLLVDGELDASQETVLYSALAGNDEMRNQMRELLAIKEAVHKDVEAFTPPPSATKSVFAAIGASSLQVPASISAPAVTHYGAIMGVLGKIWQPMVSPIVASVITALIFMNFYHPVIQNPAGNALNGNNNSFRQNLLSPSIADGGFNSSLPVAKSQDNTARHHRSAIINSEPLSATAAEQPVEEESAAVSEEPVNNLVFASDIENTINKNQPALLNYCSGTNYQKFADIKNSDNLLQSKPKESSDGFHLTMQARGISAQSYPDVNTGQQNLPVFSNIAFGFYTLLYKNLQIGFEIGQEQFGQSFYFSDDKQSFLNEQNPLLFWSGVSLRGVLDSKIDFIGYGQPFAQLTFGGTQLGPLGKAVAGIQYSSGIGLTFMLGAEGSTLLYQSQSRWYNTNKLGVTYGMLYKF
ncbi:MAG: hypothetical protein WCT77_12715 [Bacteroidota bacterium]